MACPNEAQIRKVLDEAFNEIDTKKQGFIDKAELISLIKLFYQKCGKPCDDAKANSESDQFIKEVDTNKDGKIERNEFADFFLKLCK
jgi:Ca2+-binding EF-hand superfamily protein